MRGGGGGGVDEIPARWCLQPGLIIYINVNVCDLLDLVKFAN